MQKLTERQEFLLGLIVREYVESVQPVGSKTLVDHYRLNFSSATTRNDMQTLTEEGYLRQPHTSAGRVPTEEGYRYFVQRLLGETELPPAEKRTISHQFFQARGDVDQWMRLAAAILARHSSAASLVTAPAADRSVFRQLQLISIKGQQALLVLVLQGGRVQQQFITLEEPLSQEDLSKAAEQINARFDGVDAETIEAALATAAPLARVVLGMVAELMHREDFVATAEMVHDGLANVLKTPEFADPDLVSRTLHILEEQSLLGEFLSRALGSEVGGVQVVIGGEGDWEELRDCSMVIARYGTPGLATGTLGVIGPMRMAYGRTISAVRYVSSLMSDLVSETLSG
ncbi:MAG: heat-inducible transcription repressor HrcA [Anaerolineales bacterium]|nr:heat-inducible transcription repressor HrcA [Anaerolineales bacterium]